MDKISVLIADGQQNVRERIRALIDTQPDMYTQYEAVNGVEALHKVCLLKPQVLLFDIAIPRGNHNDALALITAAAPTTHVIVMSLHREDIYIHEVFRAGAAGFLLKTGPSALLLEAIRGAVRGDKRRYCPWPRSEERFDRRADPERNTKGVNRSALKDIFPLL